ncbi:MAG TPA: hypothetical protein VI306_26330 [Pyrinomonadaceae bacterium]
MDSLNSLITELFGSDSVSNGIGSATHDQRRDKMRLVTTQNHDGLMAWLDPESERADEKYQTIRKRLIMLFTRQGASDAEALADETLVRVRSRVSEISRTYSGDPALYFYRVATEVLIEHMRAGDMKQPSVSNNPEPTLINLPENELRGLRDLMEEEAVARNYATTRYQTLIDRKYISGLSASENEELDGLRGALDEMDKPYYEAIIQRLRRVVEQRGV